MAKQQASVELTLEQLLTVLGNTIMPERNQFGASARARKTLADFLLSDGDARQKRAAFDGVYAETHTVVTARDAELTVERRGNVHVVQFHTLSLDYRFCLGPQASIAVTGSSDDVRVFCSSVKTTAWELTAAT